MRTKIETSARVQQSGYNETKDLLTLATLTSNGEQVLLHVTVRGTETIDIYTGTKCYDYVCCAFRENGTVTIGNTVLLEINTLGFDGVAMVVDGDDVKLQINYTHPTESGTVDVFIDWTTEPLPTP